MTQTGMLALYAAVAFGLVSLLLVIAGQLSPWKPISPPQQLYW